MVPFTGCTSIVLSLTMEQGTRVRLRKQAGSTPNLLSLGLMKEEKLTMILPEEERLVSVGVNFIL